MSNANLGLIPSWQFSPDPRVNSLLNPHVMSPAQIQALYAIPMPAMSPSAALGLPVVDSWWWKNRKALATGAIAVPIALGVITLVLLLK